MSIKVIDGETGELLPAPRNLPSQLFEEFDRLDDDQIMAELRGAVVEEYVYQFKQGGQMITGLSVTGVMAVAQHLGGITCGQPVWSITEESTCCDISATDHKTGLTIWGTCEEERVKRLKNGGTQVDKFVRQKALSKAQRNAIRKLIPEKIATEMIKAFIDGKKSGPARSFEASERRPQPRKPAPTQYLSQAPENDDEPPAIEATARAKDERQPSPTQAPTPTTTPPAEKSVDDHQTLTDYQNRQIHELKKALGIENKDFTKALTKHYGKILITDLTRREAVDLLAKLKAIQEKQRSQQPAEELEELPDFPA